MANSFRILESLKLDFKTKINYYYIYFKKSVAMNELSTILN